MIRYQNNDLPLLFLAYIEAADDDGWIVYRATQYAARLDVGRLADLIEECTRCIRLDAECQANANMLG